VVFEPESVKSYELGVKTTLLDGRARINYTAYRYDYSDFFSTATGVGGNFIVFTSDAVFRGLEIEGTVRATDRLDLFANFGLARGEYEDLDPLVFGTSIGEEPQRIPGLSLKAGGTYKRPFIGGSELRLSADYLFLEDHYTNLQNSELARSGNVEVWNASVGVSFNDDQYNVSLACRNCFDNSYISKSLDFSGFAPEAERRTNPAFNGLNFLMIYPGEPRSWGLTFKARF
jgi:iron complex outermembrane recepter protein